MTNSIPSDAQSGPTAWECVECDDAGQSSREDVECDDAGQSSQLREDPVPPPAARRAREEQETTARRILQRVRHLRGLSQRELAGAAGVSASVVSEYESGRRAPSVPALERMVAAAGMRLTWDVTHGIGGDPRLAGPKGRRLRENRRRIIAALEERGFVNPRVVGDVATGHEDFLSQPVIAVDPADGVLPVDPRWLLTASGGASLAGGIDVRLITPDECAREGFDLDEAVPL